MEIDSVLKRALKIFEISTICTSGDNPAFTAPGFFDEDESRSAHSCLP